MIRIGLFWENNNLSYFFKIFSGSFEFPSGPNRERKFERTTEWQSEKRCFPCKCIKRVFSMVFRKRKKTCYRFKDLLFWPKKQILEILCKNRYLSIYEIKRDTFSLYKKCITIIIWTLCIGLFVLIRIYMKWFFNCHKEGTFFYTVVSGVYRNVFFAYFM